MLDNSQFLLLIFHWLQYLKFPHVSWDLKVCIYYFGFKIKLNIFT